jgi:hypothetical protein
VPNDTVEFSAHVPIDEYNEFKKNFNQYGAVKWFINESLAQFNAQVRENPTLRQLVSNAVQQMLDDNRNSNG